MKNMTLSNIAKACEGELYLPEGFSDREVDNITIDSRTVSEGSLFVPVVGARVDGHTFIAQVYDAGAVCTLTERDLTEEEKSVNKPYIKVKSSLLAIKQIAAFYRNQLDIKFIGITGSVGKTSTKEIISSVLDVKYNVLKTQGNFNNEIGVPLTIFRIRDEHEIAVIEMGINSFGEMTRLSEIVRPDIAVITNIGVCHLENLIDRDGVLKAKTEMFNNLNDNAFVVLNGDDDKLSTISEVDGTKPIFYGIDNKCEVYADNISSRGLKGIECDLHIDNNVINVLVPVPGKHMLYNAMTATIIGNKLGLNSEEIKKGIEKMETISGRFNIIEKDDLTIIDDCYNANPVSMKASLDVLNQADTRKVAILGDMFELGEDEVRLHEEIGRHIEETDIDVVICVGKLSQNIKPQGKTVYYFNTLDDFFGRIEELIFSKDTILIKASHGMDFVKIVNYFKNFF